MALNKRKSETHDLKAQIKEENVMLLTYTGLRQALQAGNSIQADIFFTLINTVLNKGYRNIATSHTIGIL